MRIQRSPSDSPSPLLVESNPWWARALWLLFILTVLVLMRVFPGGCFQHYVLIAGRVVTMKVDTNPAHTFPLFIGLIGLALMPLAIGATAFLLFFIPACVTLNLRARLLPFRRSGFEAEPDWLGTETKLRSPMELLDPRIYEAEAAPLVRSYRAWSFATMTGGVASLLIAIITMFLEA